MPSEDLSNQQSSSPVGERSVAVVIPVYNRAAYLRGALASVMAQSLSVDEVVVVDDGSTDNPEAVVAEFPGVRIIRQANAGPSLARNAGLAAVTSDYVLFLDSDDVLLPDAIAELVSALRADTEAALAYGGYIRVDEALRPIAAPFFVPLGRFAYRELLNDNYLHILSSVMFDRARLCAVRGFDPEVARAEDYDLFLRLARRHPLAGQPSAVAKYRVHPGNISAAAGEMLTGALLALDRNKPDETDGEAMRAWRRGRKRFRRNFVFGLWRNAAEGPDRGWGERMAMARRAPLLTVVAAVWQAVRRVLPEPWQNRLRRMISPGPPMARD